MSKKKRGPKGGIKHTPGRGHDRKSKPEKKKQFSRRRQRRADEQRAEAQRKLAQWRELSPEQQRFLRKDFEQWLDHDE